MYLYLSCIFNLVWYIFISNTYYITITKGSCFPNALYTYLQKLFLSAYNIVYFFYALNMLAVFVIWIYHFNSCCMEYILIIRHCTLHWIHFTVGSATVIRKIEKGLCFLVSIIRRAVFIDENDKCCRVSGNLYSIENH